MKEHSKIFLRTIRRAIPIFPPPRMRILRPESAPIILSPVEAAWQTTERGSVRERTWRSI
jgi:hypothetical protein